MNIMAARSKRRMGRSSISTTRGISRATEWNEELRSPNRLLTPR
jgi:hypothetical protein